jgi:hypothetical protein
VRGDQSPSFTVRHVWVTFTGPGRRTGRPPHSPPHDAALPGEVMVRLQPRTSTTAFFALLP